MGHRKRQTGSDSAPTPVPSPASAGKLRLTSGPHTWTGGIEAHTPRGLIVHFPTADGPILRLGARVHLHLQGTSGEAVPLRASVCARDDAEGRRLYTLTLRAADRASHLLPDIAATPLQPRRERRFTPPTRASWVTVTAMEGPEAGRRVAGVLLDVSAHGLGMLLDLTAEDLLADSPTLTCTYAAPGPSGQRVRAGRIVNRSLQGSRVRYGVAFIGDMVGPEGVQTPAPGARRETQAYEPAWDCSACGTRLLLGHSHTHCPGCGAPRGDQPTYFPQWDSIDLNVDHWAWGNDRLCPFCATSFSDLATCCGRCGRPLPT